MSAILTRRIEERRPSSARPASAASSASSASSATPVDNRLFGKPGEKCLKIKGIKDGDATAIYVKLKRVGGEAPMAPFGSARIEAEYSDGDPGNTIDVDFSRSEGITKAMNTHSDVATLLFLSLPALGDIVVTPPGASSKKRKRRSTSSSSSTSSKKININNSNSYKYPSSSEED